MVQLQDTRRAVAPFGLLALKRETTPRSCCRSERKWSRERPSKIDSVRVAAQPARAAVLAFIYQDRRRQQMNTHADAETHISSGHPT